MQNRAITYTLSFETALEQGTQPNPLLMRSCLDNDCCNLVDEAYLICAGIGKIDYSVINDDEGSKVMWIIQVHALVNEKLRENLASKYRNGYQNTYYDAELITKAEYDKLDLHEKIEYVLVHSKAVRNVVIGKVVVNVEFVYVLNGLMSYDDLSRIFMEEKMRYFDFRRLAAKKYKLTGEYYGVEIPLLKDLKEETVIEE